MIVFRSKNGFVVWNVLKPFSNNKINGHAHLVSLKMAKLLCQNVINKKMPRSRSIYVLRAYLRCSSDEKYYKKIEELINIRKQKGKKSNYKNRTYL